MMFWYSIPLPGPPRRTVLAEIRKITDKPVHYVVNSHWHPDHWSGNEVYARAFLDLEIIATEEAREFMLNTANAWPPEVAATLSKDQADFDREVSTGKESDGTVLTAEQRLKDEDDMRLERDFITEAMKVKRTYPTLTYSDELTFRHGGREFCFLSMVGDARGATVLVADLLQSAVDQMHSRIRQIGFSGAHTLDEVKGSVDLTPFRQRFAGDDKDLQAQFDDMAGQLVKITFSESAQR
jgi:metallo-beta-lactamase superfamily protein